MSVVPTNKKRERQPASQTPARHSGEGRNPVAVGCAQSAGADTQNNAEPSESLPRGWRWTTLSAICSKPQYGWTTSAAESGDIKLLRTTDITHGPVDWSAVPFCRDTPPDAGKYLLEEGDIVVSRAGSVGFSARVVAPERSVFASYLIRFRPKRDVDGKYLEYFMQSPAYWAQVRGNTAGIAVPNVNASKLEAFKVPLAPLDQQKKIVAEIEKQFTRLDAGVAALRRVQANLKRYCAAVLKAACEGRLVPTEAELAKAEGRTYETGEQLLARILPDRRKNWHGRGKYKEPAAPDTTKLPPLPEGWTWATMPQLGELGRGKSKHRPRDDAELYDGPYPFIQTGDVRKSNGTVRDYTQTYSEFGLQQSRLWPAGTLCITIAANIAETGILNFDACFPDSVVGFVQDVGPSTTRYLEFFIRTAREKLEQFAPATAQKNINLDVLQKVAIPLPPLAEQARIVAEIERRLSIIEELEAAVAANLQRAARLRQSVLQCAFASGTAV